MIFRWIEVYKNHSLKIGLFLFVELLAKFTHKDLVTILDFLKLLIGWVTILVKNEKIRAICKAAFFFTHNDGLLHTFN